MKIIFFDVTEHEQALLEEQLAAQSEHQISYFTEPLEATTAGKALDADIVSVFVSSKVDASVLATMMQLKLVAARSTGVDHIDIAAASKYGIAVANVPSYGENTVAEYTFALLLALSRKLLVATKETREGKMNYDQLTGFDLAGKTLGIIGTGHIGMHVIKLALAFGMHVIAYDIKPDTAAADKLGFKYVKLQELYKQADIISLHAPYTKQTHHLLNKEALDQLKPNAYIINTARGELIDTEALVQALQKQELGGVALDVVEGENLLDSEEEALLLAAGRSNKAQLLLHAEHDMLLKMPNVIITKHNAYNSREALERINKITIQNMYAFIQGKPQNLVGGSV